MLGANPFPTAAHYLLAPSPSVHRAVAQFYLKHMAGRRIVGVHLRTVEYMTLREQEFPHPPSMFPPPNQQDQPVGAGPCLRQNSGEKKVRESSCGAATANL